MIALASDCLLFQTTDGESVPFSAEMISIELMGNSAQLLDAEFVKQASKAVFHYFRNELGRQTVTVGEFAGALEKVLRSFGFRVNSDDPPPKPASAPAPAPTPAATPAADLHRLANESAGAYELLFFPRLRDELRLQLKHAPRMVRFHGLRGCVKHLAGARRWSPSCRTLQDRILQYMRECLSAETPQNDCALVVD